MEGRLEEIICKLESIKDTDEGSYLLYTRDDNLPITGGTQCAIILFLEEDADDYIPDIALEKHLPLGIITVRELQQIILVACEDKPGLEADDLIRAMIYYLNHDAYLDLTDG